MSTNTVHQSIIKIVNAYKVKLATKGEEDFMQTPPINGWSYSEVYSHIFDASLLSLIALQNCIKGEGETRQTHFIVRCILFFGAFPPGKKYTVPKILIDRVKKINLLTAKQLITDFELQLTKIYPLVEKANPEIKTKHPRLGYLNAMQWLRFIEIHLNHHLKQLKRIENSFQQ